MHDPDRVEAAAEARDLGRKRRRKEGTIGAAFDFEGLNSVPHVRRLLEVATHDALALDNTVSRARLLAHLATVGLRAIEVEELEARRAPPATEDTAAPAFTQEELSAARRALYEQRTGRPAPQISAPTIQPGEIVQ